MKARLLNGRKLSKAWQAMVESQPQPGPGFLSRGGPHGQTFHQTVFRVGMEPPTGDDWEALTPEQKAGYEAVNIHRPWLVTDGKKSSQSPNPGNVLAAKRWPSNKAIVMTSRTARMMREAAQSSELSTFEGMLASGTHGGAKLIGQDGQASCQAVHRRRAAMASRHTRGDSAGMAAANGAKALTAGTNLEGRRTARGHVISATRPNPMQIFWASVSAEGIAHYNEDAEVRADYDGVNVDVSGTFYVLPFCYVPNGIEPGFAMSLSGFGTRQINGLIVTVRHQTPFVDEISQYGIPAGFSASLNFADPTTWPEIGSVTAHGRSTQLWESFTILNATWA